MAGPHFDANEQRKRRVQDSTGPINGIDYLEVEGDLQRILKVRFLKPLPPQVLGKKNFRVDGGERISNVAVVDARPDPLDDHVLVVTVDREGDFSPYTLSIVRGDEGGSPPDGIDPILSRTVFSFKAGCPSDVDCRPTPPPPPAAPREPDIDYLAKDYSSFRRIMLDRLSNVAPEWKERNPADLGVAVVEALALSADHLSYYQDAVATEAYLGTARRRVSLRRHSRLLDYPMHEGCNARAWVVFSVDDERDGFIVRAHTPLLAGNMDLSIGDVGVTTVGRSGSRAAVGRVTLTEVRSDRQVFETMHDVALRSAHDEMRIHTWGNDRYILPAGTTSASLENDGGKLGSLEQGDLLLLEEVRGTNGRVEDADRARRCIVRLTEVEHATDPLFAEAEPYLAGSNEQSALRVVNIRWSAEDALRFPLFLEEFEAEVAPGGPTRAPRSVARGNVALADHGQSLLDQPLIPMDVPSTGRYAPGLRHVGVTFLSLFDAQDRTPPAAGLLLQDPRSTLPSIELLAGGEGWTVRRDLLQSGRFSPDFVAEVESDGSVMLRFGDGILGKRPIPGSRIGAMYRVGNGSAGNVGAETITGIVLPPEEADSATFIRVRNPLPAQGGTDRETADQVRVRAPQAFRVQQRAVTSADYADMAQRHADVQKAVATLRWTGSWNTIYISVDRRGGRRVDARFKEELRGFLEPARCMGNDLEIRGPAYVGIDIMLRICVAEQYRGVSVKADLQDFFSSVVSAGGRPGFFHPDNFTFGQAVHLSQVVAGAMRVRGVIDVIAERFQRWGKAPAGERERGRILMGPLEIARVDNDPDAPENGRIEFILKGGL